MARVIDDRFELLARLGGGGMGTVWKARDLALHREVALKEVRPPDPGLAEYDPEAARALRARVLREARALARVDHPNVVTIHHIVDGGEHPYPWLVMELVTGGSLQDRLDRGLLAPAEAARAGRGMLDGLRAAHAADIQHRDIKPANILLRPDGRPVLTDFGIAAVLDSTVLTATGSIIGTPDYMAPERVAGQDGGPAADLWSLAMTLYVAVEGHNPLRRGNTLATLAAVLSEDVPPPRHAGPLTGVLTSVLVRDPDRRPDAPTLDRLLAEAEAAAMAAARPAHASPDAPVPDPPGPTGPRPPTQPATAPASAAPPPPAPAPPRPAPASPPPAPAPPPPASAAPPPPSPARPPTARLRHGRVYASALGALGVVGVLLWTLLPWGDPGGGEAEGRTPRSPGTSGTPGGDPAGASGGSGTPGGKKITIGVKFDQPGIGLKTPDGRHSGFDVDVATYIARQLGHDPRDIEWKEAPSADRERLLQRGEVDFIVATYAITDARATKVDFVGPYLVAHQDVLTRANGPSVDKPADLNDKKLCSVTGSLPGLNMKTKFAPRAQLLERDTIPQCLAGLANGEVDAVTADDAVLAGWAAREPGTYELAGLELTYERYGIGVPKRSDLRNGIRQALRKMTADGAWDTAMTENLPLLRAEAPPQQ
ncbi:bifunctional serine/threonine-protein kinase/glutamate ABC transporter substrate-binding protein [Streptomyces sp. NPDC018031]|uniref:bifunctional serine/threonine-protein kinase/glutamate ABC transporter substrate-binding protein n=1 Tax=Streptomyces sp. NPDC018031 TaxID=3365033 RepID=UPI0037A0D28A